MGIRKTLIYMIGALIFILLVSLGFWQLSRMHEKKQIENAIAHHQTASPLIWHPHDTLPSAYSKIQLSGKLQIEQIFLIDNQFHHRVPGYHVIAPLLLSDEKSYILINLGWIPKNIPPAVLPCQDTFFTGWVAYPDEKRFILGDNIIAKAPLLILQRINFALLQQNWQIHLYPFMLLLNEDNPCGFTRDWSFTMMSSDKHLGYAVQWFALSLCFLILFFRFINRKEK